MIHNRLNKPLIILLALVLLFSATAKPKPSIAQGERNYGDVWSLAVVPVLPAGIRFWVRVEAPADQIETVEINIWQNDKRIGGKRLDIETDIMFGYEDAVEYEYILDVQEQTAFRMFDPIKITLSATLVDGSTDTEISTIMPAHQGYGPWQGATADNDRLTIYISDDDINIERMVNELLPTLDLLARSVQAVDPLKLAVYTPPISPFCTLVEDEEGNVESLVVSDRRNFPCSEEAMVELYARSGFSIVTIEGTSYSEIRADLAGEIALAQFRADWGDAEIPEWFIEGFAMYFTPNGRPDALPRAQRAALRNDLLGLRALNEAPEPDQRELWDAQAFLLTLYLADLYGADAPQRIASQLSPTQPFADLLRDEFNTTPERLFGAWEIWINSSRAIEVAAYHPYLQTTPTPTQIPTATSTRTPTITPSVTSTPTQRPLFVPTNPPIPTRGLPTSTPTATVTPLPPGFFDRVTPTAAPSTSDESEKGNSQLCNTGLGALMLPVLALIVERKRRVRR